MAKKKGLYKKFIGLFVSFYDCGRNVHHKQSGSKICSHPIDRQFYKAKHKDPQGNYRTRNLKATSYDEGVKEALQFKDEVKNPHLYKKNVDQPNSEFLIMYRPWLKDAIELNAYIGRWNNEIFEMR